MKAFLLVAGLGTRLRPLTDKTPKCLLPVNGRPILEIWLDLLEEVGVDEVLINTHWLAEQVVSYVKGNRRDKQKITLFHEAELLGSAGTLLANKDWIDSNEPFFIIYGDNLTDVDLKKMYGEHKTNNPVLTLGVFETETPEQCGIAEVDENGLVANFVEKPKFTNSRCAAAGVYVADSRIFDYFPEREDVSPGTILDIGFDILPKLVGKMRIFNIKTVIDIGTIENYEKAQSMYSSILGR